MPKVTFIKEKKEIEVPVGANLRLEALKAGIELYPGISKYLNCRGNGLCGTCAVIIKSGPESVSP
ncbi:MAG: (2Fe-2S)-binding protein, partial [Gemmatales bacterium]|nr:(2Fe-2S)-binding protein [Gemmatales bacterium]MDW8385803.1 2Fe-2S iron-sulfur cluster-binding protein [Gemmatales bacterium]